MPTLRCCAVCWSGRIMRGLGSLWHEANQPGVEFHLRLTSDCSLGKSGRWFGWQCRWYDLPAAKPLGAARKKKIEDAVTLSEKVLPDLTDWVLWTRLNPDEGKTRTGFTR